MHVILPSVNTNDQKRVLLLCGGKSGEHEVSLSSAASVLRAMPDTFDVTAVVIDKETGRWLSVAESARLLARPAPTTDQSIDPHKLQGYDVVFPVLHGPNGEDGTIQGLLTLQGIPFVGSGVLGSAASMDKAATKLILDAVGIPQTAYRLLTRSQWHADPASVQQQATELGYPLFVKPANMGSSVGISRVSSEAELGAALDLAFSLDRRVLLDKATAHKPRELEVGILGNDDPRSSVVGELSFDAEFYDYETKYTQGRAQMHIPAQVDTQITERIRKLALRAFTALDCAGLARIDFFYVPQTGELFLNEVNTMPGFTATSMYSELWKVAGVEYPDLITRLLELAQEQR